MGRKEIFLVLSVATVLHLIFFYRNLSPRYVLYSGKDSVRLHYQTREYIYEQIKSGRVPFWTERMLMGFPIYADMERGILNPINLLSIYFFGPVNSYKILHFLFYISGSLGLYLLLRKDKQVVIPYIAANTIYFFNFFVLYHQQHFNMVLAIYSLPLLVLLLKKYIQGSPKKVTYSILFIFLFSTLFYFGSFQVLLMTVVVLVWYLLSEDLFKNGQNVFYKLFFILCAITVLIAPGFWSQVGLYNSSSRFGKEVYQTGAVLAPTLFSTIYPYIFGDYRDYSGTSINEDYLMHEVYVYIGVSVLAVYLIGFLPLAEERKRKAHIALIVLAVFLMVWGRTAFVRNFSLIPFSFFRYWVRAAFLLLLPISLGVGSYLADPKKIDAKAVLKVLVYPLLFFAVFSTLHYFGSRQEFLEICKIIVKRLLNIGIYNIFWCVIALASIFLLLFNGIKSKIKIYLLVVLILADIIFFGIISNDRLFVLKETLGFNDLRKGEINGRVLDLTTEINASNSLTASFWSIIGYSELVPINTIKKIEYLGLKSPRGAEFVNSCSRIRAYSRMIDLGISGFVDEDGVFVDLPGKMVEINGQVPVEMREGYVHIVKEASESIKVKTKINYYPGWLLYVDGKLKEGLIDTDTLGFINFEVHKYGSEIVLKFVPIHLYQGIFMSAIVLWFLLAYVYDFRKKLFGK